MEVFLQVYDFYFKDKKNTFLQQHNTMTFDTTKRRLPCKRNYSFSLLRRYPLRLTTVRSLNPQKHKAKWPKRLQTGADILQKPTSKTKVWVAYLSTVKTTANKNVRNISSFLMTAYWERSLMKSWTKLEVGGLVFHSSKAPSQIREKISR